MGIFRRRLSTNRKFPTIRRFMEEQLRQNLILCASAFVEQRSLGFATLGRLAAGDWRFFDHLSKDAKTFTARKYDEVMRWFHLNWPPAAVCAGLLCLGLRTWSPRYRRCSDDSGNASTAGYARRARIYRLRDSLCTDPVSGRAAAWPAH